MMCNSNLAEVKGRYLDLARKKEYRPPSSFDVTHPRTEQRNKKSALEVLRANSDISSWAARVASRE